VLMDRKHCGSLYRTQFKDEYVYASPRGIYRFSVTK